MPARRSIEILAADRDLARTLGNHYNCDAWGRFPWEIAIKRGKKVSQNRTSLGDFIYTVLKHGGTVHELFTTDPDVPRPAIFARVQLTLEAKTEIERSTDYRFDPPPFVKTVVQEA